MSKIRIKQKSTGVAAKILFALLLVVVAAGVCIMLIAMPTGKVNSTINASEQNKNTGDVEEETPEINKDNIDFDVRNGGTFVMHVALVDFADVQEFNTDEAVARFNQLFNEKVVNDFVSVTEYYNELSKGKLNVVANISYVKLENTYASIASQPFNYALEKAIFDQAIEKGEIKVYNGRYNAGIVILPGNSVEQKVTWPHTYYEKRLMCMAQEGAINSVVCHETGHLFGLRDLYTGTALDAVYAYELMSGTKIGILSPINAYHRATMNWISESAYEDDISSEVEQITKSGTYVLMPSTSAQGVVAYKFAESEDGSESFYAEYRVPTGAGICNQLPYGEQGGLYIYRVNTNCTNGNLGAYSHTECEIFAFAPSLLSKGTKIFAAGSSVGTIGSGMSLIYADGTKATAGISNIRITEDGLIFDIDFVKTEVKEYYGQAFSYDTGYVVVNADIYLNGVKTTKTDQNGVFTVTAKNGDKITVVADYYKTQEITLTDVVILNVEMQVTIGKVKINSGYDSYNIKFYEKNKLLIDCNATSKTTNLTGFIDINNSTTYKLVYTRGNFTKTFEFTFKTSGEEIVIDVDPYVDEETATRTYSGTFKTKDGVVLDDVKVYVNNILKATTGKDGKFSFVGKKGDVVEFKKDGVTLATQTLGVNSKIDVVSNCMPTTIKVNSNKSGYTVNVYLNGKLVSSVNAEGNTSVTIKGFVKSGETNKYRVVYIRDNFAKSFEFDLTEKNTTYTCAVSEPKEKTKSIFDQISEGFDFFTYNMGKGFDELGRLLNPLNWF